MLVSDIVRRVRETAGDISVIQFSNATLTDWINDAVRECVIDNSLLQARAVGSTVVGQTDYNLPENIFKLHSVTIDSEQIQVMTLQEWQEYNNGSSAVGNSKPYLSYVYAGVLTLYPAPDTVVGLVINYSKLPTEINYVATPTEGWIPNHPSIPDAFHNRLVTYCLAQVALQDDDVAKYQQLMVEFSTGMRELKDTKDQADDLYSFISVSARDGDYYGM